MNSKPRPPDLPLMPLIDVVFLILIFFVVNFSIPPGGIEIELPQASAQRQSQENDELIITLNSEGEIFFLNSSQALSLEQLKVLLQDTESYDNRTFRLRADSKLNYGRVVSVLDLLAQTTDNVSLETITYGS